MAKKDPTDGVKKLMDQPHMRGLKKLADDQIKAREEAAKRREEEAKRKKR